MPTPDHALHHDVRAVLALPRQRGTALLAPLAHDVLEGAYGDAPRTRLAALPAGSSRLPWRRPDKAAALERLQQAGPAELESTLRALTGLPPRSP
ncbi:hypothetical protein [Nocardioides aequoreus]|uniref:hypothetical protein n=1 Tax=Nocardioides aequoreus TaxID=397278 RepID=UPI0004C32208|nr:hypothetical protein [Nocardioides aequoreus]